MKHSIIAVSVFALLSGVCAAKEPQAPDAEVTATAALGSESERINYSLGYEVGKDLKREDLELAAEALVKGVQDAIAGVRPIVDASQRRVALVQIKQRRAEESLEQSRAFLAANAKQEGVTTLESGVQYRELESGQGERPDATASVTVRYRGTLIDGTEFDSSYERGKPSSFQVSKLIRGLSEAVQLMQVGDKWEIYVPSELAYGKRSPRHRIPPNSALIFELELLGVKNPVADQEQPKE